MCVPSKSVCFSKVFITHIEKQLFYTSSLPHLHLPLRHGIWHNRPWVSLSGPANLADRGAADRRWGNFPGSGKSLDNHTFHGPERPLPIQWLLGCGAGNFSPFPTLCPFLFLSPCALCHLLVCVCCTLCYLLLLHACLRCCVSLLLRCAVLYLGFWKGFENVLTHCYQNILDWYWTVNIQVF